MSSNTTSGPRRPDYRLYIDESGDHTNCSEPTVLGKRFLGLTGVIIRRSDETLAAGIDKLKRKHLPFDPDDPPILHREDILNARGPFRVLQDPGRRAAFNSDLLALISAVDFTVIAVVLDKLTHPGKRSPWRTEHPYHYCLMLLLERYCGLLRYRDAYGDVMAESRGGTEDCRLKTEFERLVADGGPYLGEERNRLTSRQLKLSLKTANVAGLQLADMLAHPLTRDVLVTYKVIPSRGGAFADAIAEIAIASKYNRWAWQRRIKGYGQVIVR